MPSSWVGWTAQTAGVFFEGEIAFVGRENVKNIQQTLLLFGGNSPTPPKGPEKNSQTGYTHWCYLDKSVNVIYIPDCSIDPDGHTVS